MHAIAAQPPRRAARELPVRPPRPSRRQLLALIAAGLLAVVVSATTSTLAYLRLPAPTGAFAVGRTDVLLTDPDRTEPRSTSGARRAVRLVAWYPATAGTGRPGEYVPGYHRVKAGLEASGEVSPLAVAGLALVASHAREGAAVASSQTSWPVVLLSPGNATNVAFYGSLAEDLASHGYVVIGIDHPYQVAAVDLGGDLAIYEADDAARGPEAAVAAKIDERVADVGLVLDRVREDAAGIGALEGRLDLRRVAVVGHSNGGITAAHLCVGETRVAACVNIDGQAAGGPFAAHPDPQPPTRPFLFLTKETRLHPSLARLFEAGSDTIRVVVPAATHQSFSDGPRFEPRLAPVDGTADHVLGIERGFVRAFLDHTLRGAPESVLGALSVGTDVYVEVYPLRGRPNLPAGGGARPDDR